MIMRKTCLFLGLLFLSSTVAVAQGVEFFPLSSVKPGLKGVGKTVFQGTQIETFNVEILGVLEKIGPGQNLILAKLSGDKLEQYGVFAGMSGSPVYIDGKLLGAVSYAFSFATAPIAGITPIGEMVNVFKEHTPTSFKLAQKTMDLSSLYRVDSLGLFRLGSPFAGIDAGSAFPALARFGSLRPIETPLGLAGAAPAAVSPFAGLFNAIGLSPVFGAGAAASDEAKDAPLEAGSTVAVQLVRGDMDVSASGTVTYVNGSQVYAFGHPFLSVGNTDMPMSKAAVLGVIPNLMNSQKISATTVPVGSIKQDRATGILGVKGSDAKLIPVNVNLTTGPGERRSFHYQVVTDSLLSPLLVALTVENSITSVERTIGGQTLQVKCHIALKGHPEVNFENSISDLTGSSGIAGIAAAAPVNFILTSGFDNIDMERVDVDVSASESTREAILEKVWQDETEARPGDEVGITVFMRNSNGDISSAKYPVKIPEGLTPGPLKILIGDGLTLSKTDAQAEGGEFIPRDLNQLIRAINNLKKNDRLYIRLFRDQEEAVLGGEGLAGLPPSILALYSSKKTTGDVQPIKQAVFVEHELPATDAVVSGRKIIQINIKG
jgi:hypothetical protein